MIEFDTHHNLYLVSEVSFITHYVLFIVSRSRLILDMFYAMFEDYCFGVFMIIVFNPPVSLTSVFKSSHSPNLERADFDRPSFHYTWLNSYFFSSLPESNKSKHT